MNGAGGSLNRTLNGVYGVLRQEHTSTRVGTTDAYRYCYGGVAFEILPSSPGWQLGAEHAVFVTHAVEAPLAGRVSVAVMLDASLEEVARSRVVHWSWSRDHAVIETLRVRAELRRLAPGQYVACATIAPGEAGASSLTTALAGAIVHREGGTVLHAAGIETSRGAVLFVGPSGAGKTTACNHASGARWLARDRAAVFPAAGAWFAWGMAGGDPIQLEQTARPSAPLSAILRVDRRWSGHGATSVPTSSAVLLLRESTQAAQMSTEDERRLLDTLARLCDQVPVGRLHTRLGDGVLPHLEEWLVRQRD